MLSELVKVSFVEAKQIKLTPYNGSHCQGCTLKPSCGQYLINAIHSNREMVLSTKMFAKSNLQEIKQVEYARVSMDADKLVKFALLLYSLPVLLILFIAALLNWAGFSEIVIVLCVFSGLFLCMLLLKHYFQLISKQGKIKLALTPEKAAVDQA